jgi:transcriptional regulator with XRE-family HTH domain
LDATESTELHELRNERAWSQERAAKEIARFLGVRWSKATFSLIERSVDGNRIKQFSGDEIIALCLAFEVPVVSLFNPPEWIDGHPVRIVMSCGDWGVEPSAFFTAVTRGHVHSKRDLNRENGHGLQARRCLVIQVSVSRASYSGIDKERVENASQGSGAGTPARTGGGRQSDPQARSLRRKDLELKWRDGAIESGRLVVAKSKTEAGKGRAIPFTCRVCAALTLWLSRFPEATLDSYVFPHHRVAARSGSRIDHHLYEVDLTRPIGSWKRAWEYACSKKGADVEYRWHDLRHTFVSRLAENPRVSEETIRSLDGHVSKRMLQRYSHIRTHAKQAAIAALEQDAVALEASTRDEAESSEIGTGGAQNWAQSIMGRLN